MSLQTKSHDKKSQIKPQKDNKSFMLKFKDKHSVISKQGLLKLLQNKTKHQQSKPQKAKPQEKQQVTAKSHDKHLQKKKIEQIIKVRSVRKGSDVSISKSVQLPQINSKFNKIHKSISTSVNLRQKLNSSPSPKIQTDSIPRPIKKAASSQLHTKQKKISSNYNFELDQFALDHLDFLDKFQQRIRKRDTTTPVAH